VADALRRHERRADLLRTSLAQVLLFGASRRDFWACSSTYEVVQPTQNELTEAVVDDQVRPRAAVPEHGPFGRS
jgi:hypothetical protein